MSGKKLDLSLLDQRFVSYYLSGKKIVVDLPFLGERMGKVKNQPPDLTAGEFNRRE